MYKSKLFRAIATLAFVMVSTLAFGQAMEVSGTVTDAGEPMAGATVMIRGTQNATVTDLDGKYAIKAKSGDVLVFSFIGYLDEERTVSSNSVINVAMSADVSTLEQVVVLGYGAQTKKKDLSASVGIVSNPEKLAERPVTSVQSMLQGQIPGVVVTNDGGSPTSTPNIVIRGQGSRNGDGVLWVVDGVPGGPINSMNDIESIVVLKDAASAAIYGAQSGAGGVILVTTKKAQKGVNLMYDGMVGVRKLTNLPTGLDAQQEMDMYKQAYANAGMSAEWDAIDGWNPAKNPFIATTRTDWFDEVTRAALYHRHNVVLNAGTEKFRNRVSFSYQSEDGTLVGTYNKSFGLNYVGEINVLPWLKISENFRWGSGESRGCDTGSSQTGVLLLALAYPRSASATQSHWDKATNTWTYDADGYGGLTTEDPDYVATYGSYNVHGDLQNPLRQLTSFTSFNRPINVYTSTALELGNFEKFKGFKFVSRFTYSTGNSFSKSFTPLWTEIGKSNGHNSLYYGTSTSATWRTENTITYDRTFGGKHTVGVLLSTTADHSDGRNFSISAENLSEEEEALQYLKYAAKISTGDGYSGPDANLAYIARLAYSYDDRYFVTASWRRDVAGRLPDEHNYGDFPSVTGAWKISSEHFFPKNDAVTLLKLRGSWGRIGNLGSIGWNYKSRTLNPYTKTERAIWGMLTGSQYGLTTDRPSALNNELTWETSEQLDFGIDMAFLRDRLTFSADYYDKRTYNLIQSQTTGWTQSIGVGAMLVNLGEIKNRGVELSLGWQDKVGHWSYYINANAAYNKNWVSKIGVYDENGLPATWDSSSSPHDIKFSYLTEEGGPLNQYYLINCLGIFQSDSEAQNYVDKNGNRIQPNAQAGDLKFEDFNGDGKIDASDRQLMGNSVPDWTYALNAGFTWKNLSVNLMFQGVQGSQALNFTKMVSLDAAAKSHNRSTEILNAWSPTNTNTNIPRLTRLDSNSNFTTASSWYLENSSYLRLKNLTISYDITSAIRKSKFFAERGSALSVYASGDNLFTLTPYTGMDPECGSEDMFKYPVSRIISFGIKLTL